MPNKFDYIIVGAGLFSLFFIRFINELNKNAIIFEKRSDIGGNCSSINLYNINVNEFGPHIFHTSNKLIWDIFNDIYPITNYVHKVYTNVTQGDYRGIYNFPINLSILNRLYGVLNPLEAEYLLKSFKKKEDKDCKSFEEKAINLVGEKIYETFFKGYTQKQWETSPTKLSPEILNRIPIRTNLDNNYYNDVYSGIPKENNWNGFINNIVDSDINSFIFGEYIDINKLDILRKYKKSDKSKIIVTAPIDEFFEYKFGELEYLTTWFETKYIDAVDYQGCATMNYPSMNVDYTRITEYKHFDQNYILTGTVIQTEFPKKNGAYTECYPVYTKENLNLYNKYKLYSSENYKDIIFAGRLGEYKYNDMDDTIENAYKLVEKLAY